MVNQRFLKRKLMILSLGIVVTCFSGNLQAAEYIQMKQGYQPVVSLEEINRRVMLAVSGDKMVPLEEGSVGRRTYLEKVSTVAVQEEPKESSQAS